MIFDPDAHELRIGDHVAVVGDVDNEEVLRAYLTLVTRARGRAVRTSGDLRHDDIVALAQVLDLDDTDLESRLVRLLGLSRIEAAEVHRRLRARAAAAASVMAAGMLTIGVTHAAASPTSTTAATTGATAPAATVVTQPAPPPPSMSVVVSAPQPAVASSSDDAPPASNAPAAASNWTPDSSSDDTEIGDAMVITQGTPPDDPNVQIGDAVTYER